MTHNQERWRDIEPGDVVAVTASWRPVFLIVPRRTHRGRWVWGRAYSRRVWVYTGFVDEPETQYGTIFDVLRWL